MIFLARVAMQFPHTLMLPITTEKFQIHFQKQYFMIILILLSKNKCHHFLTFKIRVWDHFCSDAYTWLPSNKGSRVHKTLVELKNSIIHLINFTKFIYLIVESFCLYDTHHQLFVHSHCCSTVLYCCPYHKISVKSHKLCIVSLTKA